jgi:drug/metabolite transporter (DMT)-like permease
MFFRLLFALMALFIASPPHFWKSGQDQHAGFSWSNELKYMGAGLCGVTLYMLFQNTAISFTLASNVSVLVSTTPLFTALVAHLFVKEEPLKASFFVGFAVAIVGIFLIAFNGSFILKLNPLGDFFALLAAIIWAFYSVLIRKISARQTSMIKATRKVFFYGLVFLLPFLPFFDFHLGLERLSEPFNILNFLFLGVLASAISFVTWNFSVSVLGPVKSSVYLYLSPVVTIAVSALILREKITLVGGLGIALILMGTFLSERQRA